MKKKKKRKKVVEHVLDNDCKLCVRNKIEQSSLINYLNETKKMSLVTLSCSLPYLTEMTNMVERFIKEAYDDVSDDNQKTIVAEYFTDIRKILMMFSEMKGK